MRLHLPPGLRAQRGALLDAPEPHRAGANASDWGSTQDLDGDGISELVVSAPFAASGGTVCVYPGSRTGVSLDPTLVTDGALSGYFGQAMTHAGEVNGDGYGDLLVGAPGIAMSAGRASVFHGGPTGLARAPATVFTGVFGMDTFFGASLAASDFDGDGFSDVAVGAYGADGSSGRVLIYRGSASGPLAPRLISSPMGLGGRFGFSFPL